MERTGFWLIESSHSENFPAWFPIPRGADRTEASPKWLVVGGILIRPVADPLPSFGEERASNPSLVG